MTLERFGLSTAGPRTAPTPSTAPGTPTPEPGDETGGADAPVVPSAAAKRPEDRAGFLKRVQEGADEILDVAARARDAGRTPRAILFSDMDVDGITSHAVMRTVLSRTGFDVEPVFSKKFSDDILDRLVKADHDLVVITDHGSPARDTFPQRHVLVMDHHKPPDLDEDHSHQIHPVVYGLNGAVEVCSAGIAYLVARGMDPEAHRDMSALGVIGSAGDMLDLDHGRFVGVTRDHVLADAEAFGYVEKKVDIRLYGRHGRSLTQLLMYADDPRLRGLSKSKDATQAFLHAQGIHPDTRWCHLDDATKQRLVGELLERANDPGRLIGEVCELVHEEVGSYLRDVREYGTVINGSSRYEMAEPVVAVLLGDRGRQYDVALDNYLNHKRNIVKAIRLIEELGVTQRDHLQWFHVEGLVRHTIVGSVAGAVQGKHDPDKPMIAFAYEAEAPEHTKVSGRGTRALCDRGLDLSVVMKDCAAALGGKGGGHDVAAGATIPAGKEEEFLAMADKILAGQFGG